MTADSRKNMQESEKTAGGGVTIPEIIEFITSFMTLQILHSKLERQLKRLGSTVCLFCAKKR